MQARVRTVAFQGVDVLPVDVQVMIAPGTLAFAMVGLADKAVGESRERVRAALRALGLALPPQRISVNLSPADLAKEGTGMVLSFSQLRKVQVSIPIRSAASLWSRPSSLRRFFKCWPRV